MSISKQKGKDDTRQGFWTIRNINAGSTRLRISLKGDVGIKGGKQ